MDPIGWLNDVPKVKCVKDCGNTPEIIGWLKFSPKVKCIKDCSKHLFYFLIKVVTKS